MRKLQCFEVVKIFDHILFLAVSQFDNISRRKLIRIVSYGLVNHLGCYSIQFCNISVKDDLRIPDDNDFTFCFLQYLLDVPYFLFIRMMPLRYNISFKSPNVLGENEGKNAGHTKRRSLNRNRL